MDEYTVANTHAFRVGDKYSTAKMNALACLPKATQISVRAESAPTSRESAYNSVEKQGEVHGIPKNIRDGIRITSTLA
jgi:hypothetical protein